MPATVHATNQAQAAAAMIFLFSAIAVNIAVGVPNFDAAVSNGGAHWVVLTPLFTCARLPRAAAPAAPDLRRRRLCRGRRHLSRGPAARRGAFNDGREGEPPTPMLRPLPSHCRSSSAAPTTCARPRRWGSGCATRQRRPCRRPCRRRAATRAGAAAAALARAGRASPLWLTTRCRPVTLSFRRGATPPPSSAARSGVAAVIARRWGGRRRRPSPSSPLRCTRRWTWRSARPSYTATCPPPRCTSWRPSCRRGGGR